MASKIRALLLVTLAVLFMAGRATAMYAVSSRFAEGSRGPVCSPLVHPGSESVTGESSEGSREAISLALGNRFALSGVDGVGVAELPAARFCRLSLSGGDTDARGQGFDSLWPPSHAGPIPIRA